MTILTIFFTQIIANTGNYNWISWRFSASWRDETASWRDCYAGPRTLVHFHRTLTAAAAATTAATNACLLQLPTAVDTSCSRSTSQQHIKRARQTLWDNNNQQREVATGETSCDWHKIIIILYKTATTTISSESQLYERQFDRQSDSQSNYLSVCMCCFTCVCLHLYLCIDTH